MVNISLTCSAYVTVAIALERWLAVTDPIAHRARRSGGSAGHLIYAVVAFFAGFLVNSPLFMNFKVSYKVRVSELY